MVTTAVGGSMQKAGDVIFMCYMQYNDRKARPATQWEKLLANLVK